MITFIAKKEMADSSSILRKMGACGVLG
jgi:hypothetical protein